MLLTIAIFGCGWFALLNLPRGMVLLGSVELAVAISYLVLLWLTVRRPYASRPLHTLLATLCREEGWKEKRGEG